VNIQWKHGVNALPEDEQDGRGRVSIVLWGLTSDVIEEDKSPPMVKNAGDFGGVPRDAQRKQQNHKNNNSIGSHGGHGHQQHLPPPSAVTSVAPPSVRKVTATHRGGDEPPLFVLSQDRDRGRVRMDRDHRDRMDRERMDRERIDREREWERERERREEWERSHRSSISSGGGGYGRSRSRSRERRPYPDHPRGIDRRDYYPPVPLPVSLPPPPPPVYSQPPRDDRGGGGAYSNPSSGNVRMMTGVCFEFASAGTCRYGDRCKFRHER
jgi:hypothetical protein